MSVYTEELESVILDYANFSDELIIISGYCSPDIIEKFAKLGKKLEFFFGMYQKNALTLSTHNKLKDIDNKYSNLNINIVYDYHVHTKCYIFKKKNVITNILVGSANFSIYGLKSGKNSEMLVDVEPGIHFREIEEYYQEIQDASKRCDDASIIVLPKQSKKKRIGKSKKYKVSTNPFVALIPLFIYEKNKKIVPKSSGLNWGNQSGHSKNSGYLESYFAITANLIDNHPLVFPFKPEKRTTTTGKITRDYDPITILWDDGYVMEMTFQGKGVERPPSGKRKDGDPYRCYPKQLTSASGGSELGEYIRKRMNLPQRKVITLSDLKKYGKEYIELTYIQDGYYEADFSPKK
ncbi:NgoFVII family restriction endonuclease [Streptococcus suis]|nr:NgoFVII family restriction endonuclease [Streptococcus suis]